MERLTLEKEKMMSSSDPEEGFKPIDLNSLETFNKETISQSDASEPEFNRFKLLFERPKFEKEEPYEFEAVYHETRKREETVFKPLIEPAKRIEKTREKGNQHKEADNEGKEPNETPEEKGYQDGFEKGREQGIEKGKAQGYEEGFHKGEAEGFEKGEQAGAVTGHEKGYEDGYKEGEAKGTEEARQKSIGILNTLEESLNMVDRTLSLLVDKYEARIISLIQQIAKKAVMAQLKINDGIVRQMILDALKTLVNPEEIVLSISEEDYEYIEMVKEEFFEEIKTLKSISVKSDPSVKRGGCRIDTNTASISSDPESRLDVIFEAIKKAGI